MRTNNYQEDSFWEKILYTKMAAYFLFFAFLSLMIEHFYFEHDITTLTTSAQIIGVTRVLLNVFFLIILLGFIKNRILLKEQQKALQLKNSILRKTAIQLELATDVAGIGIWIFHFEDNTFTADAKVLDLYEMSPDLLGIRLPFEEWTSRCHPDDVDDAVQTLQQSVTQQKSLDITYRISVPSGTKYIHATAILKYDEDGNPIEMIGTERNVTSEKMLEKSLITAKEVAESASKVKSAFLANMSHEIRTPLNGIIGLTDLVLESNLDPIQRNYLTKAEISAKALLGIINDILDYSKIEANKFQLESTLFNLEHIFANLQAIFGYKAEAKKIRFSFDIAADVPRQLIGDPLRLQQILSNLIGNALKFTESGDVLVTVSSLGRDAQYHQLRFDVRDTGIGMTSQQLSNLFEPFYQADASFTRKYGGTGLGLMISKDLVYLMNGIITANSLLGEGTTFTFSAFFEILPSEKELGSPSHKMDNSLYISKSLHILLVEDNDLNQLVASEILKQMGFSVTIANNGLEAVTLAQASTYDAILMDLQMPIMDGYEASRQIRKIPDYENIPIIALTAAVMQHDRELALEAGMNEHVSKPIDKKKLHDILAQWLNF